MVTWTNVGISYRMSHGWIPKHNGVIARIYWHQDNQKILAMDEAGHASQPYLRSGLNLKLTSKASQT